MNTPRWLGASLLCSVLGVAGCSAARPPTATVAQAELAVRQASEGQAPTYAPAEFRSAQEKLMKAEQAMSAEEYEYARRLAEQAAIDAQFAQAKANATAAQRNAQEMKQTIDALRVESNRPVAP